MIAAAGGQARANNMAALKGTMLTFMMPNNIAAKIVPALSAADKELHGFSHAQTARCLCPVMKVKDYDTDTEEYFNILSCFRIYFAHIIAWDTS
ncbi:hypothetical protein EW146_g7564 [Bondarzewia mesenterica]|uniref:Uncharacterized protein n=1 Tax=Bondarzewia mesenterica TaxID=1095465 RepID=A0A4S4LL13_9AGAM|nr:hypothetical protein EW146_g7564 [Bondarzewia mesenterica]